MSLTDTRVLRLALGTTLAMALAQGVAWPFAFITPVFTAMFLAAPAPCPSRPAVIVLVAAILATGVSGLVLALTLLPYLLAYVCALVLIYFLLFHALSGGANPFMVIMILVGVTAIPVLGQVSLSLALVFAVGFSFSGIAAMGLVLLSHGLVPDPATPNAQPVKAPGRTVPSADQRLHAAIVSTAVVAPVAICFCLFELTGELVTLIFIVMMSVQPELSAGIKASKKNLVGALVGGMLAIVFYELVVVAPSFTFLVLLTFAAMLVLGSQIFSGGPSAALYAASLSTFLIIVGGAIGSEDAEASSKFYLRILQIALAGLYVVVMFSLLEANLARRQRKARVSLAPPQTPGANDVMIS